MTNENEEAIKNLKKLKSFHNGSYGTTIDTAIKALEQTDLNPSYNGVKSELKPCEDCISREAVMSALFDLWEPTEYNDEDEFLEYLEKSIKRLPSVTPKFTDTEIQKMQELEQVQLEKAYELGKVEMQPCEDCISRDELNEAISALTFWHPTNDGRLEIGGLNDKTVYKLDDVWRLTYTLPSVQPQQKIGHWITTRTLMHDGEFYCDKCKYDSPNNEKWDYCPNCGAYMGGEEE